MMSGVGKGRGEFALIADLFSPLAEGAPGALGLLDDAALIDVASGHQIVAAVDTLIAGVHFRESDPPELVARKALRVNLSDIAAMGGKPIGFLQSLALNAATPDMYLEKYAAGLSQDAEHFEVPLLGGDTTVGPGPLTISITAMGTVEKGRALLRSGARPGDTLCVTGCIGDAALGLLCLDGTLDLERELANDLSARYQLPEPRLELGRGLIGLASACADISDGLVADVGHISAASDVSAVIEKSAVPLSAGCAAATRQDHKWWQRILGGGDDYELAFTVSAERLKDVRTLARDLGVPVSPIGRITAPTGDKVYATVIDENGAAFLVKDSGYRHR